MIFVQINDHKVIVDGHAFYDGYGKDIVCSAISTLFQTLIMTLDKNKIEYEYNVGEFNTHVLICKDSKWGPFLDFFKTGVTAIAAAYPNNVQACMTLNYTDSQALGL